MNLFLAIQGQMGELSYNLQGPRILQFEYAVEGERSYQGFSVISGHGDCTNLLRS